MVAASFVVGIGDGVQINVPSDANVRSSQSLGKGMERIS